MRVAARTDDNHKEIVNCLRKIGASVQSLAAVGHGVPDLLVGYKGQTILMEIKDGNKPPSQKQLTEDQLKWHGSWCGGPLAVVDGVEAALRVLGVIKASE